MYKIFFPKSVNYKGKQYLTAVSDNVQNYLHHKMVKNFKSFTYIVSNALRRLKWTKILSKFAVLKFHEILGSQSNLLRDFEKSFIDKIFQGKSQLLKLFLEDIYIVYEIPYEILYGSFSSRFDLLCRWPVQVTLHVF